MRLPIQRLDPAAVLPSRAHSGDAGLDLTALDNVSIPRGTHRAVRTGIAVGIPYGHVGDVRPRSGLARRHGLTVLNSPGTIDHGYTGEIVVLLANLTGSLTATIKAGDRIAQLVVAPIAYAEPFEVDSLPKSDRGDGGFGSTNRQEASDA